MPALAGKRPTVHLVDATLFYSPTSGGVKRYLSAKHAWLAAHTAWEHTIVVPGVGTHLERGGVCTLSGYPVPGTFNYRLPLNPRRWTRLLDALEPTLIEAGDVFHPAALFQKSVAEKLAPGKHAPLLVAGGPEDGPEGFPAAQRFRQGKEVVAGGDGQQPSEIVPGIEYCA